MSKYKLIAIEDHLTASLHLAEQAKIGLLVYLIQMVILEVRDRIRAKERDN